MSFALCPAQNNVHQQNMTIAQSLLRAAEKALAEFGATSPNALKSMLEHVSPTESWPLVEPA